MYLSKLIPEFFHGFVKIFVRITLSYTWICQNCYMDLIVFTWIVKVVLCISRPLSNKTKLKFYKDFNTCWSFCFELKVFNAESKYSMPRFRCVFGNVFTFETHSGSCLDESHLWNHDVQLTTAAAMIFIINNRFENVIPLLALSSARCWRPRAQWRQTGVADKSKYTRRRKVKKLREKWIVRPEGSLY